MALVLWTRALPDCLRSALAHSDLPRLSGGRLTCRVAAVRHCIAALLAGHPAAEPLSGDAADLADRFAAAVGCRWVRLRLEVVTGDGCKRFHADHVSVRLVTTYCGEGTQYLPPAAVAIERGGACLDLERMRTLQAGTVALFKGMAAGPCAPVVLHRSPPLEGTGEARLLLVIDCADAP